MTTLRTIIGGVLVLLTACGGASTRSSDEEAERRCDRQKMAEWILLCVEKAKTGASDEPEDFVRQCERTAVHLYCGPSCYLGESQTHCGPALQVLAEDPDQEAGRP